MEAFRRELPPALPAPDLWLARPRGFCAGVVRAIAAVEQALAAHGAPVYVYHQIVHNQQVVDDLRALGAVFVDDLDLVPAGSVLVFSAHGVSLALERQSAERGLHVVDATCPLVSKVHQQLVRHAALGRALVMIGHADHDEVVGTVGRVNAPVHLVASVADVQHLALPPQSDVAYVTQTTLSVDDTLGIIAALRQRYPAIVGPHTDDICFATQNRQAAVRELAARVDLLLVVGDRHSSNSMRLVEVGARQGVAAHLVQDEGEIDPAWLHDAPRVGVSAGASTPEAVVLRVIRRLQALGCAAVIELPGPREEVVFRVPVTSLRRVA